MNDQEKNRLEDAASEEDPKYIEPEHCICSPKPEEHKPHINCRALPKAPEFVKRMSARERRIEARKNRNRQE